MKSYNIVAGAVPPQGVAHVVEGVFLKINMDLSDKQVERLIQKGFGRYFEQVAPIATTQDEQTSETTDGADTDTGGDEPTDELDPVAKSSSKGSRKKSGKGSE